MKPNQITPEPETEPDETDETHNRIMLVRSLIGQGKRDGEIKRICSAEWGIIPRSVSDYIAGARKVMRREIGKSRTDLQVDIVSHFQAIAFDASIPALTRIRALENIARVLGLNQPTGIIVTPELPAGNTSGDARVAMLSDPQYLDYLRQQAAKEDQGASDDRTGEDPIDSDSSPVWEDSDEGAAESSAVA